MFTPMARLLLFEFDGEDPIAPRSRLASIATEIRLLLPSRVSTAARLCGDSTTQHLSGALQRAPRDGCAIEHRGQFLLSRLFIQGLDDGYDASISLTLGDLEMQISERGNLRKMGDDDYLVVLCKRPERFTDDLA